MTNKKNSSKNFPLTHEKAKEIKKQTPGAVVVKENEEHQKTNASKKVEAHIDKEARDTKNKLRGS